MKATYVALLGVVLVCSLGVSQGSMNYDFLKNLHTAALTHAESGIDALDAVTFTLVDTSLFYLQLGKYAVYQSYFGPIYLLDWTWNTSRIVCDPTCIDEKVYLELRDPALYGAELINLTTNFDPTHFSVQLHIPDFFFTSPGYRHTITNNVTGAVRIGEFSYISMMGATFGIAADYELVAGVGIQVANVDLTLDMGTSTRTVENRYTVLASGVIIDEGFLEVPLYEDVMSIWTGEMDGQPFEPQYEAWAQFVINCGLSGGRSDPVGCANIDALKQQKFADLAAAL